MMELNTRRVDVLLAERGMKRKNLAEASGLSKSNLSTVLRRGTCTTSTAGRIARGLGVSVTEIIREGG